MSKLCSDRLLVIDSKNAYALSWKSAREVVLKLARFSLSLAVIGILLQRPRPPYADEDDKWFELPSLKLQ